MGGSDVLLMHGKILIMIINVSKSLCIQHSTRNWCTLPYPGHPKGCPNYGVSKECPPKVCFVNEFVDLTKPLYFIVERFNLLQHKKRMKTLHPEWTDKQCGCCLYWQNSVRKNLRSRCKEFTVEHRGYIFTLIPEAMGVNVFRTLHRNGIKIKKNPSIVYKVALMGMKKQ